MERHPQNLAVYPHSEARLHTVQALILARPLTNLAIADLPIRTSALTFYLTIGS